ncbi:hypothetical protein AYJ57_02470 [Salipiger sp. CCB-MM3]|uniref:hypothetical protein n=1 Tax=Roseobacteraceae TaxID=2854170 RepID=UPI00080AB6EA|nr:MULTISPECIES: hypothetical protein [Roseobacteraceae]ANT59326.1 hypothetical protein AYJ57_02470 [Salipiger sp. CCB-MM3]MCA0995702.1 hypothetical protein [Alloyangia pacifica]
MVRLIPTLQCALRVALALTLGDAVAKEIFTADPTLIGALSVQIPGLATSLLCALLASIAIWLILGIGVRAVALIGLGLYSFHAFFAPGLEPFDLTTLYSCGLVALLAVPLVLFGGGRFSIAHPIASDAN